MSWLLEAAFNDGNQSVRDYVSRRLARVLMKEKYTYLLYGFSSLESLQPKNKGSTVQTAEELDGNIGIQGADTVAGQQ